MKEQGIREVEFEMQKDKAFKTVVRRKDRVQRNTLLFPDCWSKKDENTFLFHSDFWHMEARFRSKEVELRYFVNDVEYGCQFVPREDI